MKRFILMLAIFCSLGLQAQIQKGTHLIGGSIHGTYKDDKSQNRQQWSFSLSPKYAYFLKDKFALGFQLGFGYAEDQNTSISNNMPLGDYIALSHSTRIYNRQLKTNSIGSGIFIQNYFMLNDKFGFMLQSGISSNFHYSNNRFTNTITNGHYLLNGSTDTVVIQSSSTSGSYKSQSLDINIGVTPCIVYFPTPRIGLVATIGTFGLNHSRLIGQPSYFRKTTFDVGLTGISLSFQYHFGQKKE